MKNREYAPDYPALSLVTSVIRERLRKDILAMNDEWDDTDDCTEVSTEMPTLEEEIKAIQELLPKEFEITGLELLVANDPGYSSDDCSYDSYGADSNPLAMARLENTKVPSSRSDENSPRSRNPIRRRLSDLSANSLKDTFRSPKEAMTPRTTRMVSKSDRISEGDDSDISDNEDTEQGYGRQPIPHCTSPAKEQHQRRASSSNFSYDDTDMDSYANGSVEFKKMKLPSHTLPLKTLPKDHEELKRTMSGESVISYSSSLIETATINTGGYSRAA